MRSVFLLSLLPILGSCDERKLLDCSYTSSSVNSFEQCYNQHRGKGEATALVACLPFSERLQTTGIWVVGFERNDFFEGGLRPPPAQYMWHSSTGAELVVDKDALAGQRLFEKTPEPVAYAVEVVGRRALCPVGAGNAYPIAVEKLVIRRRIGSMPS